MGPVTEAPQVAIIETEQEEKLISLPERVGIPLPLAWGFLGCLLLMVDDGVESGFLSP
jgi:hypothetical protein